MANTTTKDAREALAEGANKAQDAVQAGADKAREYAGAAADKAREYAGTAADKAKEYASAAGSAAERASSTVGQGIESFGSTIRNTAPSGGMVGQAASKVADTVEGAGRYLREEGVSGMADDVTESIRRNPLTAVLIGVGVGFLLARISKG